MSLAARSVTIRLDGRAVLSDFDFEFSPGELVAVAGPNGAGKSTALKAMAGLLAPESGRVFVDDRPLREFTPKELGRRIAYLPQDRVVHWALKSDRVVALGRQPHRSFAAGESDADRQAILRAMQRMDVVALKERPVSALSGGERARVLVARALAQEAQYLIADEPAAGLDPAHALQLFEELRRLSAEGHAVLVALHDLSLAARYATRVVLIKNGRSIANGLPEQALSSANLREAFAIDAIVSRVDGIPVVLPRSYLGQTGRA